MAYGATNPDEEDFRSRYAVDTRGMPTALADIASRNLAAQDSGITKFNAVSRMNPSPGVGAVGSTPATDATNLSVSAAMDRADLADRTISTTTVPSLSDTHVEDIMARRTELASKKQELMNTLATTRIDDTKRRANILHTWNALDAEDKGLVQEHHYAAIDQARTAHETFSRESHIAAAKDFASMSNDLLQLQKDPDLKPGTPEFHAKVLEIATNHPDGFRTQAGQTLFRGVSDVHDKAADLKARAAIPTSAIESRYAKLLGDIQEHEEASKAEEQSNISAKRENVPYSAAAKYHAAQTELAALTKRYPSLTATEEVAPAGTAAQTETAPAETATIAPAASTTPPNITTEAHAALKPGDKFWWNGKQLTKK